MTPKTFLFSNFDPAPVFDDYDIEYSTVESAYQASKTTDVNLRMSIAKMSPGEAKRHGRKLLLRANWDDMKLGLMAGFLQQKFALGTNWRDMLVKFEDPIVEWNHWHDTYWGRCACPRHLDSGENWLGILLTGIRGDIIARRIWPGVIGTS